MDLYEQLVETYFTVVESRAVIPQVPILKNRDGHDWSAYPDFLAIDFKKPGNAHIVEVNKSVGWQSVKDLVKRRSGDRADIEFYIMNHTLEGQPGFSLCWRFFVRAVHRPKAEALLRELGLQGNVTDRESVFNKLRDLMPWRRTLTTKDKSFRRDDSWPCD